MRDEELDSERHAIGGQREGREQHRRGAERDAFELDVTNQHSDAKHQSEIEKWLLREELYNRLHEHPFDVPTLAHPALDSMGLLAPVAMLT